MGIVLQSHKALGETRVGHGVNPLASFIRDEELSGMAGSSLSTLFH